MLEIRIEGIPQPVRVDPAFRNLSREEQGRTVDEIRAAWDRRNNSAPREDLPLPPPPTPEEDRSFGGAVRESFSNLATGVGSTARLVGNLTGSDTLRNVGQGLGEALPADPNYRPAAPEVIEGVRTLDPRRVLSNLPRAAVEQAGSLAATMAGGAMGAAVGGPVGGLAGAAVASGAQSLGPNVEQRAQNNNEDPNNPSTGSIIGGAATTATTSALDAVGARGLSVARQNPFNAAPRGVTSRAAEVGRAAGREGLTEGAQTGVEQFGTSVGTAQGLSIDPAEMVGSGLIGSTTRVGMSAPSAAARGAAESLVSWASNTTARDMTVDQAQSVERVNQALAQAYDHLAQTRGRVELPDLVNTVHEDLRSAVTQTIRQLNSGGWIEASTGGDPGAYQRLSSVLESAIRHNKYLSEGNPDGRPDYDVAEGLQVIDETLARAPRLLRENLKAQFRDLDLLSRSARKKNVTGPFSALGDVAGRIATVGTGFAVGGVPGGILGTLAAAGGNSVPARAGRSIGGLIDRLAGTQMPLPVLARAGARDVLRKASIDPDGITAIDESLAQNRMIMRSGEAKNRTALGLPDLPIHVLEARRVAREAQARAIEDLKFLERGAKEVEKSEEQKQREIDKAWAMVQAQRPKNPTMDLLAQLDAAQEKTRKTGLDTVSRRNKAADKVDPKEAQRASAVAGSQTAGIQQEVSAFARSVIQELRANRDLARQFGQANPSGRDTIVRQILEKTASVDPNEVELTAMARLVAERLAARPEDYGAPAREARQDLTNEVSRAAALQAAQAEAARGAQIDENTLRVRAERDAAQKDSQVEQGNRQNNARRAQQDAAFDRPRELTLDEKEAQLLAALEPDNTAAEIEAYLLQQTEERLKAEAAMRAAREKSAKAPRTPKAQPAEGEPAPVKRVRARKAAETPVEAAQPVQAPAAPTVAPTPPDPSQERPESLPETVQRALAEGRSQTGALRGWRAYIQNGIGRKGRQVSETEIDRAVVSLVEDGTFTVEEGAAILAESGAIRSDDITNPIMDRIAQIQGWSLRDAPDAQMVAFGQAPAGPPYFAGINSPANWEGARDDYRTAASRAISAGEAAGDFDLVELAGTFSAATESQLPGNVRIFRVEALVNASPDPATKARRKAYLEPLVARFRDNN